jgi:hypothetical protein
MTLLSPQSALMIRGVKAESSRAGPHQAPSFSMVHGGAPKERDKGLGCARSSRWSRVMMYWYEGVGGRRIRARFSGWGWSEGAAVTHHASPLCASSMRNHRLFRLLLHAGCRYTLGWRRTMLVVAATGWIESVRTPVNLPGLLDTLPPTADKLLLLRETGSLLKRQLTDRWSQNQYHSGIPRVSWP